LKYTPVPTFFPNDTSTEAEGAAFLCSPLCGIKTFDLGIDERLKGFTITKGRAVEDNNTGDVVGVTGRNVL
jgi:hypothetical protein